MSFNRVTRILTASLANSKRLNQDQNPFGQTNALRQADTGWRPNQIDGESQRDHLHFWPRKNKIARTLYLCSMNSLLGCLLANVSSYLANTGCKAMSCSTACCHLESLTLSCGLEF